MKKLMFAVAVCAAIVVNAEEAKPAATCAAGTCCQAAAAAEKTACEAKADAAKAKTAKRMAEMRAKRDAQIEAAAKKAGMTKEEYLADRKAKRDAAMAKRLGMSKEEFEKLTPEEQRAKIRAMMKDRAAKRAKTEAEKAVKPAEAPAAK